MHITHRMTLINEYTQADTFTMSLTYVTPSLPRTSKSDLVASGRQGQDTQEVKDAYMTTKIITYTPIQLYRMRFYQHSSQGQGF